MASEIDLPRLHQSILASQQSKEVFQKNFVTHVQEFIGSHWNYDTNRQAHDCYNPVNLLSLYVNIMHRELMGNEPRMLIQTFNKDVRPLCDAMEEWGNRQLRKVSFHEVLKKAILDALFLIGIVKTAITTPNEARFGGYKKSAGEPGCFNIRFEDFFFDWRANSFEECDYIGHDYLAFEDDAKKSKLYKKTPRLAVIAKDDELYDFQGNRKLSSLDKTYNTRNTDYHPKVMLREVWLPHENKIITYDPQGNHEDGPLLEQDWIGPYCGPYVHLSLGDVPGNIMPKSPIMDLIDLHREENLLWKKLANQSNRQKTTIAYRDQSDQAAHESSKDGGYVRTQDPDGMKELSTGGPNNLVQMRAMQIMDVWNKQAGNIYAIGGLAKQSDTLGQDKMIQESTSKQVEAMASRTINFAQKIMRNLGWFFWHDPHKLMTSTYQVPGLPDVQTTRRVSPMDRMNQDFDDLDIQIDPYSLQYQSPQRKAMVLNQMVKEIFIPLLPMFHQPGVSEFLQMYVKKISKYWNIPDLIELLDQMIGVQGMEEPESHDATQGPGQGQPPVQPPPQETIHTRVSRPGATDEGHSQVMQQLLAGGNPQGQGMQQMMNAG